MLTGRLKDAVRDVSPLHEGQLPDLANPILGKHESESFAGRHDGRRPYTEGNEKAEGEVNLAMNAQTRALQVRR